MQSPFDQMAKWLAEGALTGPCEVTSEQEVVADARAIDVVVTPVPARLGELATRGWLGAMARMGCVIEAFHDPPSPDELDECLLKVIAMHTRQRATWKSAPVDTRGPMPSRALLWAVCAGRPEASLRSWAMEPMTDWPVGFYGTPSVRAPRIVVVSALPRQRDTLLLRLMGAGDTLRAALEDLHALPHGAPERAMMDAILVLLRHEIPRMAGIDYTSNEVVMRVQEAVRLWEEEKRSFLAEGLGPLVRLFGRRLGRPLTESERSVLLARLGSLGPDRLGDVVLDLNPDELARWISDPDAH